MSKGKKLTRISKIAFENADDEKKTPIVVFDRKLFIPVVELAEAYVALRDEFFPNKRKDSERIEERRKKAIKTKPRAEE